MFSIVIDKTIKLLNAYFFPVYVLNILFRPLNKPMEKKKKEKKKNPME